MWRSCEPPKDRIIIGKYIRKERKPKLWTTTSRLWIGESKYWWNEQKQGWDYGGIDVNKKPPDCWKEIDKEILTND